MGGVIRANIVLINCYSGNPMPPDVPPYGLLYVGSALQRAGHKVRILDRHLHIDKDAAAFCAEFLDAEPAVYGLGGVASAYKDAIEISKYIKSRSPNSKIITGGYLGATAHLLLLRAPIDANARGEGEETAVELVNALLENKPLKDVLGVSFVENGVVVNTPNRKQIENLDDIPFPDYGLVDMTPYLLPVNKAPYFRYDPRHTKYDGVLIDIKTSRGCTNACSFCYRHMSGIRHHSPEYVLNHIEYLQETFNANLFNLSDELTFSERKWVDDFCEGKKAKNLDFLFRITSARVDLVDEDMLTKLKDAGMVAITFGIESGSQKMLDNMHKHTTVEQNLKALRLCEKLHLQTTIALVVGLPGENIWTVFETAKFLYSCPHYAVNREYAFDDMYDVRIFSPVAFPGTLLYKQGLKLGIISDEHSYLCSLNDNQVMRNYNFTTSPAFISGLFGGVLYFVYRVSYFWENKMFLDMLTLLFRAVRSMARRIPRMIFGQ